MGKAHHAPMDHYSRKRYITVHALERLRERVSDKPKLASRDDVDLGNMLDNAVEAGIEQNRVRDGSIEGEIVVGLGWTFETPLKAIIAPNNRQGTPWKDAVVTVAPGDVEPRPTIGSTLAPAVKAIMSERALERAIEVSQAAAKESGRSPVVLETSPPSLTHTNEDNLRLGLDVDFVRLIHVAPKDDDEPEVRIVHNPDELVAALEGVRTRVAMGRVTVWKLSPVKMRTIVEEE